MPNKPTNKKLILLVIDAFSSHVLEPALQAGKLPNFQALVDAGALNANCQAIFPSITHAALSSLATGAYPKEHGVAGGYWFDVDEENIVYYIGDFWTVLNEGVGKFFTDIMLRLNRDQVQIPTIFETVERAGRTSCCINHLVHRGDESHNVDIPLLAKLVPGMRNLDEVSGPSQLYIGDLITTPFDDDGTFPVEKAGLLRRYGMDDEYSADVLLALAKAGRLADFTIAYFMDNDYESHKVGPQSALHVLETLDGRLGELFAIYGGVEAALAELTIMITGDHSQSDVAEEEEEAVILLDEMLGDLKLAQLGQVWEDDEALVVCPNMRALQIYLREPSTELVEEIANRLLSDARTDQVMWRSTLATRGEPGYIVRTKERGQLHFWLSDPQWEASLTAEKNLEKTTGKAIEQADDQWGARWSWQGDLQVVDAKVNEEGILAFGNYPNAFERIAGALECSNAGHIWASACPGAEFRLESSMIHIDGGSHGSLHAIDSTIPLIVAGAPNNFSLPTAVRTVDILPLCLEILGIEPKRAPGESHMQEN